MLGIRAGAWRLVKQLEATQLQNDGVFDHDHEQALGSNELFICYYTVVQTQGFIVGFLWLPKPKDAQVSSIR